MGENTETAILAGGCFWGVQELLRHREGVRSTRVGSTGGVEIVFDPERISYRDILEFFVQIHDPTTKNQETLLSLDELRVCEPAVRRRSR